jgi:hypothetical protein
MIVSITEISGLGFVLLFFGLMTIFAVGGRAHPRRFLRDIMPFNRLGRAVGLAVEAGSRLHISLGRGSLTGLQSAVAFVGLSMLERVARATSISDIPPVATSGDGAIAILSQDTLRGASRAIGAEFDPINGRMTGLTPFAYAAGTLFVIHDEEVTANIYVGHFASEVALITEAGERAGSLTLAGTDNIPGQAVIYATAHEPLIGEEVFAGGAYLGAGPMHVASLRAQDFLRWILIGAILLGAIARLAGVL